MDFLSDYMYRGVFFKKQVFKCAGKNFFSPFCILVCLVCFFLGHLCWKRKLVIFRFVFIVSKENSLRPIHTWVTSNFVFSKGIGVLLSVYRENVLSYLNTTFTFKLIKVNFFSSGKSITLILYRISRYENCSALRLKWFTLRP